MATKYVNITSPSQLSTLQSKNTVVVIDFHATWCGPCKVIAPIFESLALKYASPGKVVFAKCDVDSCQEVAQQFSVRAMPTFVIIKNRSEVDRIQGADRSALTAAVERHVKDIKPTDGFANVGKGYTLGSSPSSPPPPTASGRVYMRNGEITSNLPLGVSLGHLGNTVTRFLALYLTSLFSIDPIPSAASSPYAVGGRAQGPAAPRPGRRLGQ
ncbi:thioredoxin-domain-containing protein [Ascodesmis nigricans]|uniref:Thioredoxin-domain-containing protein n=1 Tax=Ascodesmis nigricans TaxID=341454 RepID=A0A4S2N7X8_9PEZI|nr:thioredoxin-domain-containing protein [Ascodesmis nigricans]